MSWNVRRGFVLLVVGLALGWGATAYAADDVSLRLLSGEKVAISGPRDKPLYLKFWATWCGKCRAQMAHLEEIHKVHGASVDVIAVNMGFNETLELIQAFQQEFEMTTPIAFDELGEIGRIFDVTVVPYSIIIGRDGSILHRGFGDRGVGEKITELVKEQP